MSSTRNMIAIGRLSGRSAQDTRHPRRVALFTPEINTVSAKEVQQRARGVLKATDSLVHLQTEDHEQPGNNPINTAQIPRGFFDLLVIMVSPDKHSPDDLTIIREAYLSALAVNLDTVIIHTRPL